MSDIGGVPARLGVDGSIYGEQGCILLSPEALDAFNLIADKIAEKKFLDVIMSNAILPFKEGDFRAALYVVGKQPFLLMFSASHSAESFVFDPAAKTFLGRVNDVFPAIYNKVTRESDFIANIEKRTAENKGLVAKYVETNAIHLIAKAVEARQQAVHEFFSLKDAAEKINVYVPGNVQQQLAELCALISPQEKEAEPCQRPQAAQKGWLSRILG